MSRGAGAIPERHWRGSLCRGSLVGPVSTNRSVVNSFTRAGAGGWLDLANEHVEELSFAPGRLWTSQCEEGTARGMTGKEPSSAARVLRTERRRKAGPGRKTRSEPWMLATPMSESSEE